MQTQGRILVKALEAGIKMNIKVQRLAERQTVKGLKVIAGRVWLVLDIELV
jgi:hypothetical protein